jgi:hypothetical protein
VAEAGTEGIELTGPGGLLTGLTKQVLETTLDVELGERLGHDHRERSGSGNVHNGSGGPGASFCGRAEQSATPTSCGNRREALADAEHRGASVGLTEAYMQGVVAGADSHPRAGTIRLR